MEFYLRSRPSGMIGLVVTVTIRRIPVQTPLDVWPGFRSQPHYKAHGDISVEWVAKTVINNGLVVLPPCQWSKVDRESTK